MTICICGHDLNKHGQQGCMTITDFDNDKFCPCELTRMDVVKASAEAAEARAAQLETDNDEMQSYINEIRVALHTEKDELTIDAVRRVISERDELARKLEKAQQACSYWLEEGRFLVANSPAHQAAVDMLKEVASSRDETP